MSTKKTNWLTGNGSYFLESITNALPELPVGLYRLEASQRGLYLQHTGDKFDFPYKIYGLERPFINRVLKTYHTKSGNLGILLNGVKGTGKTVTAELIANELKMPVIIVTQNFQAATPSFINSIEQDIIIFFDEYEKIYGDREHSILTVMDGVLSTEYRRLFLLTTNTMYINENMLSRPSRIRYVKEFKDLSVDVINEIMDDMLERPEFREDLVRYIATLRTITVDIVKSVIDEVNMHGDSPDAFKDIFNVKMRDEKYNVFDITEGEPNAIKLFSEVLVQPRYFDSDSVIANANRFMVNSTSIGTIKKLISKDTFVIEIILNVSPTNKNATSLMLLDAARNNNIIDAEDLDLDEDIENDNILHNLSEANSSNNGNGVLNPAVLQKKNKTITITRVLKIEQTYGSHYSYTRYMD